MEKETIKQSLREVINELTLKMGFLVEVEIEELEKEKTFFCNIKTEESSFLIGKYGANLQSLQHIARVLARKRIAEPVNFILDVNLYQKEKNNSIVQMAKMAAQEALENNKEIFMRPMSAYERRIVHMELSENKRVETSSFGDGLERRVIVRPASN